MADLPEPLAAATVIVLRDGPAGLQALLLQRNDRGQFGGMWVFPGGRVDPADEQGAGGDELGAARAAAVREAAEEAGLDLAADALVPLSHWLPPPIVAKRFATWFFVTPAPPGEVVVDGAEVLHHAWMAPGDALARQAQGLMELAPPTWVTLHGLVGAATTDAAMAAALAAEPPRFAGRTFRAGGIPVIAWAGDAGHLTGEDAPGPRHRLWMDREGWRYERSDDGPALVDAPG